MLDSLRVIAELLRVFAFSLLGITVAVVIYALLQVLLQGDLTVPLISIKSDCLSF